MTPPTGPSPLGQPPAEGLRAQAMAKVGSAVEDLVGALAVLRGDQGSEVGKAIAKALNILGQYAPEKIQEPRPQAGPGPTMLGGPRPTPMTVAGPPLR